MYDVDTYAAAFADLTCSVSARGDAVRAAATAMVAPLRHLVCHCAVHCDCQCRGLPVQAPGRSVILDLFFTRSDNVLQELLQSIGTDDGGKGDETQGGNKYRQMFSLRVLHYLAFFILLYVGIELTMGGAQLFIDLGKRSAEASQVGL